MAHPNAISFPPVSTDSSITKPQRVSNTDTITTTTREERRHAASPIMYGRRSPTGPTFTGAHTPQLPYDNFLGQPSVADDRYPRRVEPDNSQVYILSAKEMVAKVVRAFRCIHLSVGLLITMVLVAGFVGVIVVPIYTSHNNKVPTPTLTVTVTVTPTLSATTNATKATNKPWKRDGNCFTVKPPGACEVVLDYGVSAIVSVDGVLGLVNGGCGSIHDPIDNGTRTALVPCQEGSKYEFGGCVWDVCLAQFADTIPATNGTVSFDGPMLVITCFGDGPFYYSSPSENYTIMVRQVYVFKRILPRGLTTFRWACGTVARTQTVYVSRATACVNSRFYLSCLNSDLMHVFVAFFVLLVVSFFGHWWNINTAIWVCALSPFLTIAGVVAARGSDTVVQRWVSYSQKGHCEECGVDVGNDREHLTTTHRLGPRLTDHIIYRTFAWAHSKGPVYRTMTATVTVVLLIFVVLNFEVAGAVAPANFWPLPSKPCLPYDIGDAKAVAVITSNTTCTGTSCTENVDIFAALEGISGYTLAFLNTGQPLAIRVRSAQRKYGFLWQYQACKSVLWSTSRNECYDLCDTCLTNLKANGNTTHCEDKNSDWKCPICGSFDQGSTCASCTHVSTGDCYDVGQITDGGWVLTVQALSGGTCAEFEFDASTPKVVNLQKLGTSNPGHTGMVAVKDGTWWTGAISTLGGTEGFGNPMFINGSIICVSQPTIINQCMLGKERIFLFSSCCLDTFDLRSALTPWLTEEPRAVDEDLGAFNLIWSVVGQHVTRNPSDVTVTLMITAPQGCYSCAMGATTNLSVTSSGPGWFDISVDNGKVTPMNLEVQKGMNSYQLRLDLSGATGTTYLHVGANSIIIKYTLDAPPNIVTQGDPTGGDTSVNPCTTLFCGLALQWHLPEWSFPVMLTAIVIAVSICFVATGCYGIRMRKNGAKNGKHE